MGATIALVVAEEHATTRELDRALRTAGFAVRHAVPGQEHAVAASAEPPDIVLVSASVGLHRLATLGQRFAADDVNPAIVVFPQDDFEALEACVTAGFDWVMPPFLPALLRSRLSTCWERSQLATAVEDMAAVANLREYERDMSIAREIQAGFLPEQLPAAHGWDFAVRFRPAKEVAGDFYDGFELVNGRRLGFLVADVCDKGVGAALFMALIRTLLRHTAEHTGSWWQDDVVQEVLVDSEVEAGGALPPLLSVGAGPLVQSVVGTNRYMARNHLRQGYFATLFFGVLDPTSGALLYINGGHNPPVLVRADGEITTLRPTGPAVGILADSSYTLGHTTLGPGDALFVYTDGVVDARDPDGGLFGYERMLDAVRTPCDTPEQLLDIMDTQLGLHVGQANQFDDITMLAVRRSV
ncbi:PP2C family protein-serine/threonine phosphatase [Kutzneria chonburiensis]|uniref:PP2C family protein-serine/threonine phosphatase n=1 Tax=Kutzneria chonburiensis TaxID=1483604 RepID=A0ABV6N5G1_9PSEU|nr:SpoIIE family protein phosphatase [Kutzneria chonburiensis]